MCNLLSLPEEIFVYIIKLLDFKSVYSLYNTCSNIRNIICMLKIKKCEVSHNKMSLTGLLKLPLYKNNTFFIQELNLSCVSTLNATLFVSATKKLKCLKVLNVAHTKIGLDNLFQIYKHCSSIIDITINFMFNSMHILSMRTVTLYQDMFQNFKRIHFVGTSTNVIQNNLPKILLQKTTNIHLEYTIISLDPDFIYFTEDEQGVDDTLIPFSKLHIYAVSELQLNQYINAHTQDRLEYILFGMTTMGQTQINYTKVFSDFLLKEFHIGESDSVIDFNLKYNHKTLAIACKRDSIVFDNNFFYSLRTTLINNLVYCFNVPNNQHMPPNYERFQIAFTECNQIDAAHNIHKEPLLKRPRLGSSNLVIDFEETLQNKDNIHLTLCFTLYSKRNPVTLPQTCSFLSKLKHLNLIGSVHYSCEFFNILFRNCKKLETLDYSDTGPINYVNDILKSMPLSNSIKNIRIICSIIDFQTLITYFSQCSTLENIHLCALKAKSLEICDYHNIFQNCINLYCLHIYIQVSENNKRKQLRQLEKNKLQCKKKHISVELITNKDLLKAIKNNPFSLHVFDI